MSKVPLVSEERARKLYSNDNWVVRRRVLFGLILWKAVNIQYLIGWAQDTVLNQQIAIAMVAAIVAETATYVAGAVVDDKDKRANLPPPTVDNSAGEKPPAGFAEE